MYVTECVKIRWRKYACEVTMGRRRSCPSAWELHELVQRGAVAKQENPASGACLRFAAVSQCLLPSHSQRSQSLCPLHTVRAGGHRQRAIW